MTGGSKTVAIVGAGIVGVSTALNLQRDGHDVVLIDRGEPGEGASFGNGGVLASCSIVPVTVPGLIGKVPKMLLDANQPLFFRWGYLPKLAPWLLRYLRHANPADTKRIAAALMPIVGESLEDHQALAQGTAAERWIRPSDYLFLYNDRPHYQRDSFGWDLRRAHGFRWRELDSAELWAYDPIVPEWLSFAACVPGHGHITDPGRYVKDLAAHVVARGGKLVRAEVTDLVQEASTLKGVRAGGETIACDAAVLCAGAWSAKLAKKMGIDVPLETERGYHLELWEPSAMPRAPVMVAAGKFVMTPMDGRIRLAGVVEFGGLEAGPSRGPAALLERNARTALPGITWKHTTEWLGHRPAPADSIPIIGAVPGCDGAFMGFGHHHVGLTGGPKTGRLLAQLIGGTTPNIDLAPYSPARFVRDRAA